MARLGVAFLRSSECRLLRSVWFGALSSVMSLTEHDLGGIFDKVNTTNIQLTLSTRQTKLGLIPTYDANFEWYSTGKSSGIQKTTLTTKFLAINLDKSFVQTIN